MPHRSSYEPGTPSWIDLSTTNPEGAKAFYHALFGWDYDDNPTDQGGTYVMARKEGRATAGMMQQAPEQAEMGIPPMWNTYVTVRDLDETLAAVDGAGGSVMVPAMDVMTAGRMGVVVDPTGAVMCLWQPVEHIGAEVINEHGTLTWNEVHTPDVDAAAAFYGTVFGWTTEAMDMGPDGTYTVFNLDGEQIGGGTNPAMPDAPAHWSTVFHVDSAADAVATASANGGQILAEPMELPVGTIAVIADPQGAVFQVIEPAG